MAPLDNINRGDPSLVEGKRQASFLAGELPAKNFSTSALSDVIDAVSIGAELMDVLLGPFNNCKGVPYPKVAIHVTLELR